MDLPRARRRWGPVGRVISGFIDLLAAGALWTASDDLGLPFQVLARVLAVTLVLIAIVWFGVAWMVRK